MTVVSVVACGPSALQCGAAEAPGIVLAVNDAALHVRHDAIVSMDGRWVSNRIPWRGKSVPIYLRDRAFRKTGLPREAPITLFEANTKSDVLGTDKTHLTGLNSGACALNLAAVFRPSTIYLYGFDYAFGHGEKREHFFGSYAWVGQGDKLYQGKFDAWRRQMDAFAPQMKQLGIRVVNTFESSAIRCFEFGRPQ